MGAEAIAKVGLTGVRQGDSTTKSQAKLTPGRRSYGPGTYSPMGGTVLFDN